MYIFFQQICHLLDSIVQQNRGDEPDGMTSFFTLANQNYIVITKHVAVRLDFFSE